MLKDFRQVGISSMSSFILYQVNNLSFYFWHKKKDFMKQDKITYDYMKHNCDKSQNYTY